MIMSGISCPRLSTRSLVERSPTPPSTDGVRTMGSEFSLCLEGAGRDKSRGDFSFLAMRIFCVT
jgi:hypothetical protein